MVWVKHDVMMTHEGIVMRVNNHGYFYPYLSLSTVHIVKAITTDIITIVAVVPYAWQLNHATSISAYVIKIVLWLTNQHVRLQITEYIALSYEHHKLTYDSVLWIYIYIF